MTGLKTSGEKTSIEIPCVIFQLAQSRFALPIAQIKEISSTQDIRPLPNEPRDILGMLDLRGRLIPVVNLYEKFQFFSDREQSDSHAGLAPETEKSAGNESIGPRRERGRNTIIVEFAQGRNTFCAGLLVDRVIEVYYLPIGAIEPPPNIAHLETRRNVVGIFKRNDEMVMLVDCRKMFEDKDA